MAAHHRHPQPAEAPQAPDSGRRGLRGARERPVGPIPSHLPKTTTPVRARNPPRTPALTDARTFAKQPRAIAVVSDGGDGPLRTDGLARDGDRAAGGRRGGSR
jgi:hypothetical protein